MNSASEYATKFSIVMIPHKNEINLRKMDLSDFIYMFNAILLVAVKLSQI